MKVKMNKLSFFMIAVEFSMNDVDYLLR